MQKELRCRRGLSILTGIILLLMLLLTGGGVSAADPDQTSIQSDSGQTVTIAESAFTQNKYHECYYWLAGNSYEYDGKAVTFKDADTIIVDGVEKTLRNAETEVIIKADAEAGTASISLSNITMPVYQVSGSWNASYGGGAQYVYNSDIEGMPEVRSPLKNNYSMNGTIELSGLKTGTTYHLTGGRIFEEANQWSPGIDFGNGIVTEAYFSVLPDITFTLGAEDTAAEEASAKIAALPAPDQITLTDQDAVIEARAAYDALTDTQKANVDNLDKLEACETKIQTLLNQNTYLGVKTEAKVYDDFTNDLWLQFQQKDLNIGDTAEIYPWRLEQAISSAITNNVERPNFHYDIISGDSITLSTSESTDRSAATAVKAGTTVVQVTYDEFTHSGGTDFPKISDVNTGYMVFTVGETGEAEITASEDFLNWSHYDTIYYSEGETTDYPITVEAEKAESVTVTCNGIAVEKGDNDVYTLPLENRSNIIGIQAVDAQGNVKSMYRVIDARFIEIDVTNKTAPGEDLTAGQTANVSFRGVTMPVYKLATIYNPCWESKTYGTKCTRIQYHNDLLGDFEGKCSQWDLATNNDFDVTFSSAGTYQFTSEAGKGIASSWWGSELGTDMKVTGAGSPNMNAGVVSSEFSTLPEFSITVTGAVPAEKISLSPETQSLKIGETSVLNVTAVPTGASLTGLAWESSDPAVAAVDENGKVTASGAGEATITATLGTLHASSTINVSRVDVASVTLSEYKLEISAGLSSRLTASVQPADATDPSIIWKSSNESVATVATDGTVRAHKDGTAQITATADGVSAVCEVTVTSVPVTDIDVNPTELTLAAGKTQKIQTVVKPETASEKALSWNSDHPEIADVESDGTVVALTEGTAKITVSSLNGITRTVPVTVTAGIAPVTSAVVNPIEIYTGTSVTVNLTDLTKPDKVTGTIWEEYTVYDSNLPGLGQIISGENIQELSFTIDGSTEPGIYYLTNGRVHYNYGGARVQGVFIIGNTEEDFYEADMPVIAIRVLGTTPVDPEKPADPETPVQPETPASPDSTITTDTTTADGAVVSAASHETQKNNDVKTGVDSDSTVVLIVCILAGAVLTVAAVRRKQKEE